MQIDPVRGAAGGLGKGTLVAFALLALPSLALGAGWLVYRSDPALVIEAEAAALELLAGLATPWLLPALAVVLLWPPVLPGLRLLAHRLGRRLSFNRKLASDLLQRLSHLETVPDLLALGRCYLDGGQPALALPPLARAVEREPTSGQARLLLARALLETQRPDEALAVLEPALAADPSLHFGDGLALAAEAALAARRPNEALAFAEAHRRRHGPRPAVLWREVEALEALGRKADAAERAAQILALAKTKDERPEDALARARARVRACFRRFK